MILAKVIAVYLLIGILINLPVLRKAYGLDIKAFTDLPMPIQLLWFACWVIIWPYSVARVVVHIVTGKVSDNWKNHRQIRR